MVLQNAMLTCTSLLVTFALLQVTLTVQTSAAGKRKARSPEQHDHIISSVTANSVTVTKQKETRTFMVTPFTEMNVNGQKATIADLKPGMTVTVTIGMDPTRAGRIIASGTH